MVQGDVRAVRRRPLELGPRAIQMFDGDCRSFMRHETAAMTMEYAHSTSERRRAAVEKVLA